ncbi:MAG: hypothetical protein ACEPO2_20105 [Pelagibaca sp.]
MTNAARSLNDGYDSKGMKWANANVLKEADMPAFLAYRLFNDLPLDTANGP